MFKKELTTMVAKKSKVVSCSTPEHQIDSPSRDSDSEAASPVPFLCTQDGAEGETDVVWNYYTPKSGHKSKNRIKNSTPLSRKSKKSIKSKLETEIPKRKTIKTSHKRTELFKDLMELNQNINEFIKKKTHCEIKETQSGSEEDIFSDIAEVSPKTGVKNTSRCLRKNLLSSKFYKPELDVGLESDDSLNECLIKASQVVEEKLKKSPERKNHSNHSMSNNFNSSIVRNKNYNSPTNPSLTNINNDTFDHLVGDLDDDALEFLTQMPIKNTMTNGKDKRQGSEWMLKETVSNSNGSKMVIGRHSSMPESPSVSNVNKPSTSGMVFGRYNTMPYENDSSSNAEPGDSPIRCTPEEIKKKHKLAREKLLAKRLLPFTSQSQSQSLLEAVQPKKSHFQLKIPSSKVQVPININNNTVKPAPEPKNTKNDSQHIDIKSIIEKKRQEALMKLRRRQQSK